MHRLDNLLVGFCLLLMASSGYGQSAAVTAAGAFAGAERLRVIDGKTYEKSSAGIQKAIDEFGKNPGTIVLLPGIYQMSQPVRVADMGISILGFGHASTLLILSPTADVFQVQSDRFLLSDVEIDTLVPHTAGSVFSITGSQGTVRNVRLDGNFFNGFTLESHLAGVWTLDNILLIGGQQPWNYFLRTRSREGTIASTHLHNISMGVRFRDAAIVLDSGTDTFTCSQCELGAIALRDSLNTIPPRWVRFTDTYVEAGGSGTHVGTGLTIEAGRDVRYQGYFASSETGVRVGARAIDVDISHTEFVNIGHSGVEIAAGAKYVNLTYNSFADTSADRDAGWDAVSVAPGAANFQIDHNVFRTEGRNRPRYAVHLQGGNSNYSVSGNRFVNTAATPLKEDAASPGRTVVDNR